MKVKYSFLVKEVTEKDFLRKDSMNSVFSVAKYLYGKIIEGQNITFSYDGTEVLKGINISISKGKIVGVLGANGAGKSTLLKILCGILNPKIGRILYKSKEIKNVSKREIA